MKKQAFFIAAVYDTETTNIIERQNADVIAHAFPILFIDNDLRDVDLYNYEPDRDDKVHFYRTEKEMLERIDTYIRFGYMVKKVPIICAYNLMFDLQPLMYELRQKYLIKTNAQSSTNVYVVDLYDEETDQMLLRFWDTFHLEMRGLSAMGETAGLAKASGSWDYSLVRTQETPLTDEEYYYAKRDVQVIPAYLKYLLHANEWMKQADLGVRILTKTSIVRQMARKKISNLRIMKTDGKIITVDKMFSTLCDAELPTTYSQYALRKACFRGGFTFTAAKYASTIQRNVVSADVTSMHHTFINGRMVPNEFHVVKPKYLAECVSGILNVSKEYVMSHYDKPFNTAIHARLVFRNIRIKKASAFAEYGIALIPLAKFRPEINAMFTSETSEANDKAEDEIRRNGWKDTFSNAIFAFGKLYQAEKITIHVNEIELWLISRVYEWDSLEVVCGEAAFSFIKPPDYVALQSNMLFETKSAAKYITNHYRKGIPYNEEISPMIPNGITHMLQDGTCEEQFFEEYYINTVKGMFNGIYGTMAQDIFKPNFKVDDDGQIMVDIDTVLSEENWDERQPKSCRVLYTYGMRIVAGSRMHMVLAIEELFEKFKNKIRILGGDTDSMKISCDEDVTDDDLDAALKVFEDISAKAIETCMERLRRNFSDKSSLLTHIGGFEIENRGYHYDYHLELWNKARVSYTAKDNRVHVTCAGLSRPIGKFHIEHYMENLIEAGNPIEEVLQLCIGYNVYVTSDVSFCNMGHRPKTTDIFCGEVTDYLGNTTRVFSHESVALYEDGRWLGETTKYSNNSNVMFLDKFYGRKINTDNRYLKIEDGYPCVYTESFDGLTIAMFGKEIDHARYE